MKDKKIVKHSAGCIVIDKENKKVILTVKVTDKVEAELIKTMMQSTDSIKIFSFTKGKIEEGNGEEETALRETQEESGIDAKDITIKESLGYFSKDKRYGSKTVHMYLGTLNKKYDNLHPSDTRHLACGVDIEKVEKVLEKKEERKFWNSDTVQNAIKGLFKQNNDLPLNEEKNDVIEIDTGIIR